MIFCLLSFITCEKTVKNVIFWSKIKLKMTDFLFDHRLQSKQLGFWLYSSQGFGICPNQKVKAGPGGSGHFFRIGASLLQGIPARFFSLQHPPKHFAERGAADNSGPYIRSVVRWDPTVKKNDPSSWSEKTLGVN